MKKILFLLLALIAGAPDAFCVVLVNDPFSYGNGPLVAVSGGAWVHHNGSITGEVDIAESRVFLTHSETEDVSINLAGQPYPATTNVFLYVSFKLNLSTPPSSSGDYFAHFKASGPSGAQRGKIFITTNGVPANFYRLGVASSANSVSSLLTSNLSYNTDYAVVMRYAPSNAATTLWLNPTTESDFNAMASDGGTTITVVALALRQSSGVGGLFVDDLLVGTTFSDVASNSPPPATPPTITTQPVSQTATQNDNVTFTVVATGSPPLSYQWQLNQTNIENATNEFLALDGVTTNQSGDYSVTITNSLGSTNSQPATLTVYPLEPVAPAVTGFSLLNYNTHGNAVSDWTTNSLQVQAIGRQVQFLDADIITFQEIPMTNSGWSHLGEFVTVYRPGFHLATNSGTDGFIRSAILSRYPITRSTSWLDNASLVPFGYSNSPSTFTRDLFEAVVSVPGFPQPLHVFTTHLKSGNSDSLDARRRAAEASAISNYFAAGFLTTNDLHPYLLTGDLNEDILIPATGSQQPIQRLTNAPTGLHLTTPTNSFTGDSKTFSIQDSGGLSKRYDYILPNGLLYSNIASSQIFRTDRLNPVPPNLNSNDDQVASDHLPVFMVFNNPYDKPFRLLSIARSNSEVALAWQSVPGQPYRVETSTDLAIWTTLANNLVATNFTFTYATNLGEAEQYFRIHRLP